MYRNRTYLESIVGFFAAAGLLAACDPEGSVKDPDPVTPDPDVVETRPLSELQPAPSNLYPTSELVHGRACTLTVGQMSNKALAGSLNQAWELISSLEFQGKKFGSAEELAGFLSQASPFEAQQFALAYNIHMNEVGLYGQYAALSSSQLTSGKFEGQTAKELLMRTEKGQSADLQEAMAIFNEGFGGCVRGTGQEMRLAYFRPIVQDNDGDGVTAANDCDDNDLLVGGLLYENDFSNNDGWFNPTKQLPGEWIWQNGKAHTTGGSQQAMLGRPQQWDNVVAFATVSSRGATNPCGNEAGEEDCTTNDRWRTGIVLRAEADDDQGEGFHGYRCALSSNAVNGCYEDGLFLQIGEFMDSAEDGVGSEGCNGRVDCLPDSAFDQLVRKNHPNTVADLSDSQTARLKFFAVGRDLYCEATGPTDEKISASATDRSMNSGTVGLSTLNMKGEYDHIRVCEAFGTPDSLAGGYDWEAALGSPLRQGDDDCDKIDLPFPITFYGTTYGPGARNRSFWINSNGNVTFNGCNTWYALPQIPYGIRALVGVTYGDFNPALGGDVFWAVKGDAPNRRLVVTYNRLPEFLKGGQNTFQIQFFEGSNNIQFGYDIVSTNGYNWNAYNGVYPPMKVGLSSGNGRWAISEEGDAIPGLDNHNICYIYDGVGNYDEIRGSCP